ncbi:MAG: YARHG domain-containing protein [Lachnospiraceae bacterium]|nr:YARHG domain-containing protein [Lachnospiraceae bacterium]
MICPKCGANLSGQPKFCPKCGTKLESASARTEQQSFQKKAAVRQQEEITEQRPKKRGTSPVLLVLMLILLLAVAGGGGFITYRFLTGGAQSGGPSDEDNIEETDQDEEDNEDESEEESSEEETETSGEGETESEDEGSIWEMFEEESSQSQTAAATEAASLPSETTTAWGNNPAGTTAAWGNNPSGTAAAWETNPSVNSGVSAQGSGGYILPDSSSRQLTESDLLGLTSEQLRIARNEIYARHGRKFQDEELQAYFDSQPWYNGTIDPAQFDDMSLLSQLERSNLEVIKKREAVVNGG